MKISSWSACCNPRSQRVYHLGLKTNLNEFIHSQKQNRWSIWKTNCRCRPNYACTKNRRWILKRSWRGRWFWGRLRRKTWKRRNRKGEGNIRRQGREQSFRKKFQGRSRPGMPLGMPLGMLVVVLPVSLTHQMAKHLSRISNFECTRFFSIKTYDGSFRARLHLQTSCLLCYFSSNLISHMMYFVLALLRSIGVLQLERKYQESFRQEELNRHFGVKILWAGWCEKMWGL